MSFSFVPNSNPGGTSLFGSDSNNNRAPKPSGSLFGTTSNTQPQNNLLGIKSASNAGSLVGSTATSTGQASPAASGSSTTSLFKATSAPGQNSLFGSNPPAGNTGSLFSAPNKSSDTTKVSAQSSSLFTGTNSTSTQSTTSGAFSTAAPTFSLFSSTPSSSSTTTTPTANKPSGLFNMNSTTPAGVPSAPGTKSGSLFGTATANNERNEKSGNPDANSPFTAATLSFGQQQKGLDAVSPLASNQGPSSGSRSLFASSSGTQQGTASTPSHESGQGKESTVTSQNTDHKEAPNSTVFSGSSTVPNLSSQSDSKPGLFTSNIDKTSSSGTSNIFASKSSSGTAPPTTAPSLFNTMSNSTTSSATQANPAAPQSSTTQKPADPPGPSASAAESATSGKPTLFTPASGSSTTNPFQSSSSNLPAESTRANAEATDAKKGDVSSSSSNIGAKPTYQSRLKNKSMDEIITRWASDLQKYQKEFQSQAAQVATWDKTLVSSSEQIQKLYGSTLEAERATAEVERQLTVVENDQSEIEYWLEHYEKQVDELLSSHGATTAFGEGLQGPDAERERTFKLAERLNDQLIEMGKDLVSMVDEINEASRSLNKGGREDDPLSRIVKILNGHLGQLQLIDQSSSALQAKVLAAQSGNRGILGGNSILEDSSADTFYRSYVGRR